MTTTPRHRKATVTPASPTSAIASLLPPRRWVKVDSFPVVSGSRTFTVKKGDPCKLAGRGRGGAAGSGWTVTGIETSIDTGEFNVTVEHYRGEQRIVKSHQIVYVRPRKIRVTIVDA